MKQFFELLAWILGIMLLMSGYTAYQTHDYSAIVLVLKAMVLVFASIGAGALLGRALAGVFLLLEFDRLRPWRWRLAKLEAEEFDAFYKSCRGFAFVSVLSTMALSFYAFFGLSSYAMTALSFILGPLLPFALILTLCLALAPFAGAAWLMNRLFLFLTGLWN